MDELDQLEMFKEQLAPKGSRDVWGEKEKVMDDPVHDARDEKKKKKRRKEIHEAAVRTSPSTLRKLKALAFWLEMNGHQVKPSLASIIDEAVDYLIEGRYPQAKKYTFKG